MRKEKKYNYKVEPLSVSSKRIYYELGFKDEDIPFSLVNVNVLRAGTVISGIGVENPQGGVEFVSADFTRPSYSIGEISPLRLYCNDKYNRTETCCVFYDILDYLAYIFIRKIHMFGVPNDADCFIMSSSKNYHQLVVETDVYKKILLFLPKDVFGRTMSLSIQKRNPTHVINCDFYYGNLTNLFDFMKTIKTYPL
nr:hypothetical protein [uncultured Lachnoclostridium sp.]